jgi:hypothetical protein
MAKTVGIRLGQRQPVSASGVLQSRRARDIAMRLNFEQTSPFFRHNCRVRYLP